MQNRTPRVIAAYLSGYSLKNFAYVIAVAAETFVLAVGFGQNKVCVLISSSF
ncbi:hypothetical protein AXF42_Ash020398 [Apostasia shenzhenica]|uniref:Uncharacterized protein n=1 Tax=Apostasia shenzhenica TaxID=1088818 RepID=A0A2I0AA65_9ASPA|nr:hypothetical protein AXF42_Ash020398 [Apostasia shenzhenica]